MYVKFFGLFINALCKAQAVCFEIPACGFDSGFKAGSSRTTYRLVLDRTNWKSGTKIIKILILGMVHKGVDFQILFKIMPEFGNKVKASSLFDRLRVNEWTFYRKIVRIN